MSVEIRSTFAKTLQRAGERRPTIVRVTPNEPWNSHPKPVSSLEAMAFDLDTTLVDSQPVSQRALERLVFEYDANLDIETLMSAYGLPLSRWLPANVDSALFRTLHADDMLAA